MTQRNKLKHLSGWLINVYLDSKKVRRLRGSLVATTLHICPNPFIWLRNKVDSSDDLSLAFLSNQNTALGDIGQLSEPIQEAVLWAVRFESEPGVRAEALQSLVKLDIGGKHIAAMLQDKLLVEPDQLVRV